MHRDFHGEFGPRVLTLFDGVFQPTPVSMEKVPAGCADHEAAVHRLEEMPIETLMALCKIFGLLKLLPGELRESCIEKFDTFELSYQKATRYILDPAAMKRKEPKKELNH